MLTRLEVDGFKNLIRFEVDFGPFNCLAGPNGIGKSNIFDAIRFLSLLSDNTLNEAACKVRGEFETADVRDIFWTDGEVRAEKSCLAAEMIVPDAVMDDIGREMTPSSTYLRYEVENPLLRELCYRCGADDAKNIQLDKNKLPKNIGHSI